MTIKIAKFFSGATGMPPPLPPPNAPLKPNNKLPSPYNPYMDDEDDNMSLYSTSASVITTRDHPFNNSQRPLLADKKHSAQLMPRKKQQQTQSITKQTAAYYYQQQRQQSQYISPFVQQQKRDTAKGLHGFNDFDILSQQYNEHLASPHIGYPYGSPPSPTVASSDFVFDGDSGRRSINAVATSAAVQLQQRQHKTPPHYGNVPNCMPAASTPSARYSHEQLDYYSSSGAQSFIGKSSRFEDDFCCRRNVEFAKNGLQSAADSAAVAAAAASSSSCSSVSSGPFIFGLPHEQQRDGLAASRLPAAGRDFVGECLVEPALSNDSGVSVAGDSGPSLMQSSSDTSSTSHDSSSNNRSAGGGGEGGISKLLLRRSKAKKKKNKASVVAKANLGKTTKQQTIKCVVVGDGAVGKTNLILSYLENRFNPEHVPTASDIYNGDVMVNDSPVHLTLCDTAGQDTLDPLRELSYPDSDVFLLCFSVARPETFHAIKTKWAPKFARTRAALILVGTQADLRSDAKVLNKLQTTGEKPISYADAWDLATTIGAKYIETSSATQDKVKEVFDTAIWEGLRPTTLPPTPSLWKKLFCLA